MRTLVLAERPFRDLRSRAILDTVAAELGADPPPLLAMRAPSPVPGYTPVEQEPDLAAHGIGQVLIAGVFAERPLLEGALRIAAQAHASGIAIGTRGLSLERGAARRDPPAGIAVLDAAAAVLVREHHTANTLLVWRVAAPIRIAPYAERHVAAEPALPLALPEGSLLGLAVLGGEDTRRALAQHAAALRAFLAPCDGWPVLPLPVELPEGPLDDLPATRDFAAAILPASPLLLPELADPRWRRRHLTLPRLSALAARCAVVVTSQDLPAALAIAAGVPVLGLALGPDRRAVSCLATLANALPAGSDLLFPAQLQPGAPPFASASARA